MIEFHVKPFIIILFIRVRQLIMPKYARIPNNFRKYIFRVIDDFDSILSKIKFERLRTKISRTSKSHTCTEWTPKWISIIFETGSSPLEARGRVISFMRCINV